jgi:Zn-dependent M16 (insulinase) family peptidase
MRKRHLHHRTLRALASLFLAAAISLGTFPGEAAAAGKPKENATENSSEAITLKKASEDSSKTDQDQASEDSSEAVTLTKSSENASESKSESGSAADNPWRIGYQLDGFTLTDIGYIKSVSGLKLDFTHDKTGARVVFILNDDPNRAYTTVFQTAPSDDTGKLHVLEHAESAASEKYPGRDVFFYADSNCYLTSLNAFTSDNATAYQAASMDEDQLETMVNFYMDCAFHSAILTDENYFKSEAWRYELTDPDADLTRTGVVYNEMKGVFGNIRSAAMSDFQETLFPDTAAQYNSGGLPEDIVKLSYDDLIRFYKECYQPSNSTTLFYGDVDVERFLKRFNDDYFAGYSDTKTTSAAMEAQKPFDEPVDATYDFPVSKDAEDTGSEILYGMAMPEDLGFTEECELKMAAEVLADPSSHLMQKLNDSGIGSGYNVYAYYTGPQMVWLFTADNADPDRKDEFKKTVLAEVKKAVKDGLNKDLLENVYTYLQMGQKLTRNNENVGIRLGTDMDNAVNSSRPEMLDPADSYDAAYRLAKNGGCEKLLQSQVLDNKLAALVTVTPKKGLQEKNEAKDKEELQAVKDSMSDDEISDLVRETKEFAEWNDSGVPDSTAEKLKVVDAGTAVVSVADYKTAESDADGVKIRTADSGDGSVSYCRYLIDLSDLSDSELQKLSLFCQISGGATREHTAEEVSVLTGKYLYQPSVSVTPYQIDGKAAPYLNISFFAEDADMEKAAAAALECALDTDPEDKDNIAQLQMNIEDGIQSSKNPENILKDFYAASLADSNDTYAIRSKISGLSMYRFLEDYQTSFEDDPDKAVKELKNILVKIRSTKGAEILVSGNGKDSESVSDAMVSALKAETDTTEETAAAAESDTSVKTADTGKSAADKKTETAAAEKTETAASDDSTAADKPFAKTVGIETNADSCYVVAGYDAKESDDGKEDAYALIAANVLTDQYMIPTFRFGQGAYGAYSVASPQGIVGEQLYRADSFDDFLEGLQEIPDKLKDAKLDDEHLNNYKLSALAGIGTPSGALNDAMQQMVNSMKGQTPEYMNKLVSGIREATVDDVTGYAEQLSDSIGKSTVYVLAPAKQIDAAKDQFDSIEDLR